MRTTSFDPGQPGFSRVLSWSLSLYIESHLLRKGYRKETAPLVILYREEDRKEKSKEGKSWKKKQCSLLVMRDLLISAVNVFSMPDINRNKKNKTMERKKEEEKNDKGEKKKIFSRLTLWMRFIVALMASHNMRLQVVLPVESLATTFNHTDMRTRKDMSPFHMPHQVHSTGKATGVFAPLPSAFQGRCAMGRWLSIDIHHPARKPLFLPFAWRFSPFHCASLTTSLVYKANSCGCVWCAAILSLGLSQHVGRDDLTVYKGPERKVTLIMVIAIRWGRSITGRAENERGLTGWKSNIRRRQVLAHHRGKQGCRKVIAS